MPVEYLQIVSVPVSSQDRAREFYVQGLGWDLLSDEEYELAGQQFRWLEVRPHGARFGTMRSGGFRWLVWCVVVPPVAGKLLEPCGRFRQWLPTADGDAQEVGGQRRGGPVHGVGHDPGQVEHRLLALPGIKAQFGAHSFGPFVQRAHCSPFCSGEPAGSRRAWLVSVRDAACHGEHRRGKPLVVGRRDGAQVEQEPPTLDPADDRRHVAAPHRRP